MFNPIEIAGTLLVAFAVTVCTVPMAKELSKWFGIVQGVSGDRLHAQPTPLLGGVAIIAGFMAAIGVFGSHLGFLYQHQVPFLVIFSIAMFVVGLIDDVIDLRPRHKLILELIAICLLAIWGPQLDLLPYHTANVALTIFWLVTATNAFNLVDGLDGLAAGVGIAAALSIAAVAGLHQHQGTMTAALGLAGALAGFLLFNFPPASIFMGDEGALAVGLVLGILSIQASHFGEGSLPARIAMPLLVLMVPLLDTVTVTVTRLATGNPVSKRGLDHSHHRLARLGMSRSSAAATLIGLQVIASACAVALTMVPGYEAVLLLPYMALFFALVALFLMDRSFDTQAPGQLAHLPALARIILNFGYKRRLVEAVLDVALISGAYFGAAMLRYDFDLRPDQVETLLVGLPWVLLLGCGAFLLLGVYRGIWRYTGLAEGVRFAAVSVLAGVLVWMASAVLPIAITRATAVVFVLLLFDFLVATRWSFHLFQRIGRWLATSTMRALIVGADARGQAAIQHLQAALGTEAQLVGVIDEDSFKHRKLFHGYPVLGAIGDLDQIFKSTPFDEIVIAQETLSPGQLDSLQNFALEHRLYLRRFWLEVTDLTAPGVAESNRKDFAAATGIVASAVTMSKNPGALGS